MAHVTLDEALQTASATTVEELRALYVSHGAKLRQTLARLAPEVDADDLLQETFLIALSKTEALGRAQSQFAWLYGIAVKLAATRRRTARLRRFFGLDARLEAPPQDSAARSTEARDARRRVFTALDTLSQAKREVFVLFELQGVSGEEIALALDIPLQTVWSRLFNARREVSAAVKRQLVTEARTSGLSEKELEP